MVAEARAGSQVAAAMATAVRGVVRVPETPDTGVRAVEREAPSGLEAGDEAQRLAPSRYVGSEA